MRAANDIRVGDRVIRGPTWVWKNQGDGTIGIVTKRRERNYHWTKVKWANGRGHYYRTKESESLLDYGPPKDGWADVIRVDTKFDRIERRMDKNMAELKKLFERAGV